MCHYQVNKYNVFLCELCCVLFVQVFHPLPTKLVLEYCHLHVSLCVRVSFPDDISETFG